MSGAAPDEALSGAAPHGAAAAGAAPAAERESEPEPDPEPAPGPEPECEPETETETECDPGPESKCDPECDPEPGPESALAARSALIPSPPVSPGITRVPPVESRRPPAIRPSTDGHPAVPERYPPLPSVVNMTREPRDTRRRTSRPTTVPTVLALSLALTAGATTPAAVALPDVPAAPAPLRATAAVLAPVPSPAPTPVPAPGATVVGQSFGGAALPPGWKPVSGTWKVRGGRLVGDGGARARITFGTQLTDYRFEATARFVAVDDASRWLALGLDLPSSGAAPWSIATVRSRSTAANGVEFALRTTSGTWNVTDTAAAPAAAGTGRDVRVRVDVHGMRATWYLDGRKVLSTDRLRRSANGRQALLVDGATVAFDDVRVTALPSANPYLRGPGEPALAVAHRGASASAPENTLAAQELARRAGADLIETDGQISKDGVPYVMHDDTVDRTTDGTGDLTSLTSAQLDELDAGSWFSSAYAGEHVPTLRAQGADLRARGGRMLLEIKRAASKDQVARMFDALRAAGILSPDRVFVQSFSKQHLRWARELAPALPRGYLTSTLDADPVAVARELGLTAYNPKASALTARPSVVGDLHRSGVATMVWTVDDPAQWKSLDSLGVDGVITNRPAELIAWQEAQD